MTQILIIAEHADGKLNPATAKCVSCAAQLTGASIDVAVFAQDAQSIAEQASKLAGVSKVLSVSNAANAEPIAAILAPQIVAMA